MTFKQRIYLFAFLALFPSVIFAQAIVSEEETRSTTPEAHIFATFVKSFDHGLSLTIEEEIRSAPSHRSHTTLGLGYSPIEYLHIYTAYTVKVYGDQGWKDPNKYIRHRANILLTGQVKLGQWNLSLREGVMLDARADEIDKREKNAVDATLRSRLQVVYAIPETPLSIVGKFEILSTLNAPVDYINSLSPISNGSEYIAYSEASANKYGQYISELRPELGLQWKIDKKNSLTLAYRYNYIRSRDINVLDSGDAEITNKYTAKHLILLSYKLGW
jgi:hypothetical protein